MHLELYHPAAQVHAAAMNPIDYKLIKGDVPGKKNGRVGFDFAGVVEAVGPGCSDKFKVGDEVFGDTAKRQGSFAEYVSVLEACVCLKPEGISFREAAAVPLAGAPLPSLSMLKPVPFPLSLAMLNPLPWVVIFRCRRLVHNFP